MPPAAPLLADFFFRRRLKGTPRPRAQAGHPVAIGTRSPLFPWLYIKAGRNNGGGGGEGPNPDTKEGRERESLNFNLEQEKRGASGNTERSE